MRVGFVIIVDHVVLGKTKRYCFADIGRSKHATNPAPPVKKPSAANGSGDGPGTCLASGRTRRGKAAIALLVRAASVPSL